MNKNSKRIMAAARKSAKAGNPEYATQSPSGGYHSDIHGKFKTRRIPNVAYKSKKKAKPFPVVDDPMSLMAQRSFFYGI